MYHRVNPDGALGAITCQTFREQLKKIKRDFNPTSLTDLLETNAHGRTNRNSVVITFDDGYQDFFEYAFPILQEEGIPATIFVATGFIDEELWLWPDQIEFLLEETNVKKVSIKGLGEVFIYPERRNAWHRIADHCLTLPNSEKLALIEDLARQLYLVLPKTPPAPYRPMTWKQLRQMSDSGIIEVGSHSHSHPIMSKIDRDELTREVMIPKNRLTTELGIFKPIFCYPNGQPSDYTLYVVKALKFGGYKFGVVAYPGKRPIADPFEIKRYAASNSMMTFDKALYGVTRLAMF